MGETGCPECGNDIESADDFVQEGTVEEVESDGDSFSLYGNKRDLFLCKGCRKPLGVGKKPS